MGLARTELGEPGDHQPHPARVWLRGGAAVARANPLTVALIGLVWGIGAGTRSVWGGPAPRLADEVGARAGALRVGHWWCPLSSALWCRELGSYLGATVVVLALVPVIERRVGARRAAVLLVGTQVLGVLCGMAALGVLDGWHGHRAGAVVVGPIGAVLGLALAASAAMPTRWRRRLRVMLLVVLALLALYSARLDDLLRLTTGLVGLGLGTLIWRADAERRGYSKPEVRLLLALIVAACAVGPLIAAADATRVGPLSLLRYVFAAPPPEVGRVARLCAGSTLAGECARLHARLRLHGLGPAVMSAMPVLLLLAAAQGVRLGRRAAWLAATSLNVALAVLGILLAYVTATSPREQRLMIGPGHHPHAWVLFVLPLMQPMSVAFVLLLARDYFRVRAPIGTYRAWSRAILVSLVGVSGLYLIGAVLLRAEFQPVPSPSEVLADLPSRFLPPGYLGAFEPAFLPTRPITTFLYEWTGVVFWAVVVVGALRTFARPPAVEGASLSQVRKLLATAGGSLSYPVTWAGNSYLVSSDHAAAIAYRVIGGVALTTGDPIGDRASHQLVVREFVRHCNEHGWSPCLYAVDAQTLAQVRGLGWRGVQIGEEALLRLGDLSFTGKRWQNARTATNRATRAGISAEWWRFWNVPSALADQIRVVCQQWLADKPTPEMGFTLGGLAELADGQIRLLIAVDGQRRVHAITSWLPVRHHGHLVGYTLDLMRRRPDAFNGIMEFLIASALKDCQAQGLRFVSLSGAPMARVDRGEPLTRPQRLIDLAARTLEPIYGFRSLLAFKARFHPSYQPLYLAYPDPLALPKVARAIARAYVPRLTLRQIVRLTACLISGYLPGARKRPPFRWKRRERQPRSVDPRPDRSTPGHSSSRTDNGAAIAPIRSPIPRTATTPRP